MIVALAAAVWALRGDADQANTLREEAYEGMIIGVGDSPKNWGRTEYY